MSLYVLILDVLLVLFSLLAEEVSASDCSYLGLSSNVGNSDIRRRRRGKKMVA